MAKFKKNDNFKVKSNGFIGKIVNVLDYTWTASSDYTYEVEWNHFPGNINTYTAKDSDDLWEKIYNISDAQEAGVPNAILPIGIEFAPIIVTIGEEKTGCQHKWVEVGFVHSKVVCYHCNAEKS